ncbi:magnesium transporter [Psychromonas sp.]|nr:magnesium transporter [Psychromonas sp.]
MKQENIILVEKKVAEEVTQNVSAIEQNIIEEQASWYKKLAMNMVKISLFAGAFIAMSAIFSMMSTVHGKDIPEDYFINGYPTILGLMDSEFFMGLIFMTTISVILYVLYLLWTLHEVAVHKVQKAASQHVQIVFALSLCGLFIDKVWWVLAIIIAFTRWDLIGNKLSEIISHGMNGQHDETNKGDK